VLTLARSPTAKPRKRVAPPCPHSASPSTALIFRGWRRKWSFSSQTGSSHGLLLGAG
jgi:hypothetical protein